MYNWYSFLSLEVAKNNLSTFKFSMKIKIKMSNWMKKTEDLTIGKFWMNRYSTSHGKLPKSNNGVKYFWNFPEIHLEETKIFNHSTELWEVYKFFLLLF